MAANIKVLPRVILLVSAICVIAGLAACSLPGPTIPAGLAPPIQVTQAYQTVAARMTLTLAKAADMPGTPIPSQISTTGVVPGSTDQSALTATPTSIATPIAFLASNPAVPCNRASPGIPIDITIPDDTQVLPGQAFSKTWRLQNTGSCTWTRDYTLVWFSSERFDAPAASPLAGPIAPGQIIDLTLDMRAPDQPGSYQSNWKLRGIDGRLFGIGPNGNSPFWVRITVLQPPPPPETQTPVPSPTAPVFLNGIANLAPGDSLDLDTNQKNPPTQIKVDLHYERTPDKIHDLLPQSNARFGGPGTSPPTLADCQAANLSDAALHLESMPAGSYFCFHSSQGLPGWIRVILFNPQDGSLAIEILVWSVP